MSAPRLNQPISTVNLRPAELGYTNSEEHLSESHSDYDFENRNLSEFEIEIDRGHERQSEKSQERDVEDTHEAPQPDEDTSQYPSTWKLLIIVLALDLALFCMALDDTIIGTALPKITDQFDSLGDVGWYTSAYLLTRCSFQLPFGKFYSYFSIKWTFITAVVIFEIGSAISGAAPNSPALIFGRAIAGLGSSGIFAGTFVIIAHTVPLRKRPIYTGLFGGIYGIAAVLGPVLGGILTDSYLTWRWCFYINLPIGAFTLIVIIIFLKLPANRSTQKFSWRSAFIEMDIPGVCVLLPCIVCLLLVLQWGGSTYPWNDARIIALLVLFAVLALVFGGIQYWNGENATVPGYILKQRTVAGCALFSFCLGGSFFVLVYWIPIWFQAVKGVSAIQSGIHILPLVLGVTIFSIGSGGAISALGYYNPWLILSSVAASIGAGLLTTFKVNSSKATWIGFQALFGIGMGCGMPQTTMAGIQNVLPIEQIPIGTALITFTQNMGGAIFSSVAQNIFTNGLFNQIRTLNLQLPASTIVNSGATSLREAVPPKLLGTILIKYNQALTQTWFIAVALSCLSLVGALMVEWKSIKRKNAGGPA